jgi:DoxX-like family
LFAAKNYHNFNFMEQTTSKTKLWTGRVLSTLTTLFMLFDAVIHLMRPIMVTESFTKMGYSLSIIVPLSIVELLCITLYVIPRTSISGAILLTGYLGGAVDANVRAQNPLFSLTLFPVYIAILLWLGLYLRFGPLRRLVPLKTDDT